MEDNVYANVQPNGYRNSEPVVRCPGKEITGMILGINSLLWGSLGLFFCWHIVIAIVYGGFGIGFGIAATILRKKVHEVANQITKKIEIGGKLGIAGIVCGAVSIVLGIMFVILIASVGIFGLSLSEILNS